jgi:hypothetical protein
MSAFPGSANPLHLHQRNAFAGMALLIAEIEMEIFLSATSARRKSLTTTQVDR